MGTCHSRKLVLIPGAAVPRAQAMVTQRAVTSHVGKTGWHTCVPGVANGPWVVICGLPGSSLGLSQALGPRRLKSWRELLNGRFVFFSPKVFSSTLLSTDLCCLASATSWTLTGLPCSRRQQVGPKAGRPLQCSWKKRRKNE